MGKLTKIQKQERIDRILQLIGDGYFTYQIVDICKAEWGVTSRRTIEKYLTQVYSFLKTELNDKDKDRILLEYERLIQKYERSGDAKIAIQYRQMRDKILGLYITKTDVTTNGKDMTPTIINIIKPNE